MKRALCSAALVLVACGSKTPPAATPADSQATSAATSGVGPGPGTGTGPAVSSVLDAGVASATDAAGAPTSASAVPESAPPAADDSGNDAAAVAYLESIQVLYKQQRPALTTACWLHAASPERAYAGKALVRVGSGGKLISVKTEGTDEPTSACIDKQIKKWKLPPPNGTATVNLPIRLHRD